MLFILCLDILVYIMFNLGPLESQNLLIDHIEHSYIIDVISDEEYTKYHPK
jgi:hypothetical protein